jgi:hypothetical protein
MCIGASRKDLFLLLTDEDQIGVLREIIGYVLRFVKGLSLVKGESAIAATTRQHSSRHSSSVNISTRCGRVISLNTSWVPAAR